FRSRCDVAMEVETKPLTASTSWYCMNASAVLQELQTDAEIGLSAAEAARRLERDGQNELLGRGVKSTWLILAEQLRELMVVILIVAAVLSALLGDYNDAVAIGAIVALNAILGFSQEYRAEKAIAALKQLAIPTVRVRRDGRVRELPSVDLVS